MGKLEQRYPQKRILITGATSGFGEALAYALAQRGWKVAVSGREADAIERTVARVKQQGGEALGLTLEVRDSAQWMAVRQQLDATWGGIDILCNNAGVADSSRMVDMTDEDWRRLLDINLEGVIHGCRAYVPDFIARKSGYILNVASVAGLLSMPEMANYSVSKAGVISLSETLKAELSADRVGITALCPAGFRSNLLLNAAMEGKDVTKLSSTARAIQKDMDKGKHTSETVAAYAISAMERGDLYAIPQPLYRFAWALKRLAPNSFYRIVGWLYRNRLGPFAS